MPTLGIGLIILSYLSWLPPYTLSQLTVSHILFMAGNILFFDWLCLKYSHYSFIKTLKQNKKAFLRFIALSAILVFLIEFYGHWIGKYWYFPPTNLTTYFLVVIPLLLFYILFLLETYLGAKAVIETFLKKEKGEKFTYPEIKNLSFLGIASFVGIVGLTGNLFSYTSFHSLAEFFSVDYAPVTNNGPTIFFLLLISIFLWVFLEYIAIRLRRPALISLIISGKYYLPVLIVAIGLITAVHYEYFNAPSGLWRYANIPFSSMRLFGVPILVFVTWPIQYFSIVTLYYLFFPVKSEDSPS